MMKPHRGGSVMKERGASLVSQGANPDAKINPRRFYHGKAVKALHPKTSEVRNATVHGFIYDDNIDQLRLWLAFSDGVIGFAIGSIKRLQDEPIETKLDTI